MGLMLWGIANRPVLAGDASTARDTLTAIEYQVYSDVLPQLAGGSDGGRRRFVLRDFTVEYGVHEYTVFEFDSAIEVTSGRISKYAPYGPVSESLLVQETGRLLDSTVVGEFNARSAQSEALQGRFRGSLEVTLLHALEYELMSDHDTRWREFCARFPDASDAGLISLSRVGFSADSGQALMYFGQDNGRIASGSFVLLRIVDGVWQISATRRIWFSSARPKVH